jgi:hypothetical protein
MDLFDREIDEPMTTKAPAAATARSYPAPEPGVYRNLPEHVYHGDPRWAPLASSSKLKKLLKSPRKLRYAMDHAGDEAPSDEMLYGTAIHAALLQPDRFDDLVVWAPFDHHPGKVKWPEFCARHQGKAILKPWTQTHDRDKFNAIIDEVRGDETARLWLAGDTELTIVVEINGALVKTRIDALPRIGGPVDLKTTHDADPRTFGKTAYNMGYHIQGALYKRSVVLACEAGWLPDLDPGNFAETFRWVVVETDECPDMACMHIEPKWLGKGNDLVDRALDDWLVCNETGVWPGYPRGPRTMFAPGWAWRDMDGVLGEEMDNDVEF